MKLGKISLVLIPVCCVSVGMGLFSPTDVYEESWLLLFVTKLLGLFPVKCCKISCTAYIYVILLLILYYGLSVSVDDYANNVFKILDGVTTVTKIRKVRYNMNFILLPIMVISSIRSSRKVQTVYEEVDNVDKSLKFLNTEIDHKWCMRYDVVRITSVILVVILFNLMDYYSLLDNDKNYMYVLMWILDRIPDFVNCIVMCSFSALIYKIRARFQETNRIMQTIGKNKNFLTISEVSEMNEVSRVKLLKLLQLKLCKTVAILNEAYGFQFTILSMLYIICICLHLSIVYVQSDNVTDTIEVALSVLWGTFDVVKLAYIIHLYRILTIQHA